MKLHAFALATLALLHAAPTAWANPALASRYACVACHQADRKLVGPSWNDIAAKYAGTPTTTVQLADSIKRGGGGKWGPVPMPAQPAVSAQDAQALAQWILEHRSSR